MERQLRMVKRLFLLLCVAACTMGILGTPSCEIRALIIDSPSYNFAAHRIESATPPYQTDSSTVIDVPVYVYGTGAQFAFKVGADGSTNCADAAGYTAWTAATNRLQADIAAVADGLVKLCLIGRSKKNALSYNTQPYSKATVYKWNKDTEGPGAFSIDEIASPSNDNTPTISWTAATGAAAYDVRLSNSPDCSSPFQAFNDVTGTSVDAAAIADGSFHVCVAAKSASNLTTQASNNGIQFVIDTTPPGDFEILTPSGTVSGLSHEASWTAAEGAEQYHLMLASDAGCTQMVSDWNSITTTSAMITVPQDGDYYLCAEAIDAASNKLLAPAKAFSVEAEAQEIVLRDSIGEGLGWVENNGAYYNHINGGIGFFYHFPVVIIQPTARIKITKIVILGDGEGRDGQGGFNCEPDPTYMKHYFKVWSSLDAAAANGQGGDIASIELNKATEVNGPTPTGGTSQYGCPILKWELDVSRNNAVLEADEDYVVGVPFEGINGIDGEYTIMESDQPGESDYSLLDAEPRIYPLTTFPGAVTGRIAIKIIGTAVP